MSDCVGRSDVQVHFIGSQFKNSTRGNMSRKFILLTIFGACLGFGLAVSTSQAAPLAPKAISAVSGLVQVQHQNHQLNVRRHHHHGQNVLPPPMVHVNPQHHQRQQHHSRRRHHQSH